MVYLLIAVAALIAAGVLLTAGMRRSSHPRAAARAVVGGLVGVNAVSALACFAALLLPLLGPAPVLAQEGATTAGGVSNVALGAALATGLACIGAGIAVGIAGAAAIGGITEKPEILGRTLIFVGLAEGIAIYGLIISFLILNP